MSTCISLPFSFGPDSNSSGALTVSSNPASIWQDRVYIAVLTGIKERVMMPQYGTTISASLFEPVEVADKNIRESIAGAFHRWLPKLTLLGVDSYYDTDLDELNITINYALPDGSPGQVTFNTRMFNRYGEAIKDVR